MKAIITTAAVLCAASIANAEIKVVTEHRENSAASREFKFPTVPPPSDSDAASKARFSIVSGWRDENGAELTSLNNGRTPSAEDQPDENFFFEAGTEGGRLQIDLGRAINIAQINTYSWHPTTRGPQVYKVYGSDGAAEGFDPRPGRRVDPVTRGWKLIATVNTRPKSGNGGGQHGVSIQSSDDGIGPCRYLLFDMSATQLDDNFGNTFYSEIDVVERK